MCSLLTLHSNSVLFAMWTISSICFIFPTSRLQASTICKRIWRTIWGDPSQYTLYDSELYTELGCIRVYQFDGAIYEVTLQTPFRALCADAWLCDPGSVLFRMAWAWEVKGFIGQGMKCQRYGVGGWCPLAVKSNRGHWGNSCSETTLQPWTQCCRSNKPPAEGGVVTCMALSPFI